MSHSERESGSTKMNSSKESMKMLQAESEKGVVRQLLFPVSSKNARNEKIQYDKNTIESFIHNPIRCGFLYAYCEENYCSENIKFAMEIDKFRDFMAADIDVWRDNKDWREMDRDCDLYSMSITNVQKEIVEPLRNGTLLDPATWPSKKIDVSSMLEQLRHIWDVYLSDDGESQICMPSKVYIHTMNRLKLAHVYGPDLFSEAMLDPIKTIRVDIQPRFVVSQHFKEMRVRMTDLSILPLPSSLNLPPPDATVRAKYSVDQLTREGFRFALDDFLVDKVLYEAFLKYLDHQRSSENLRCLQAINLFKNKINSVFLDPTLKPAAIEQGWLVYKYFIAEESAYEVSGMNNE